MTNELRSAAPNASVITAAVVNDDSIHAQPKAAPRRNAGKRGSAVRRFVVVMFMLAVGVTSATAQFISITASPLHISKKIVQVTGELKIIDAISVAGVAGLGTREGQLVTVGGGQVRVYLSGGFNGGTHIGAEAIYSQLGNASSIEGMVNLMNGMSTGPFVGYKHVFSFGLTIDVQGGIRYSDGRIVTGEPGSLESKLGPMANINVGWSF